MHNIISASWRKLVSATAKPVVSKYVQKERGYNYKGLRLRVSKDVFHPGFFRSTKVFAEWLESKDIQQMKVLELGSGSGLLSLIAAKKGAFCTAVDINPKAVANTELNASLNKLDITTCYSDLFSGLGNEVFDWVLINPPYYPKAVESFYDHAWYCGENFDYFESLFRQVTGRPPKEEHYMILSDTCDVSTIISIATKNDLQLENVYTKKISGELLTIYTIQHIK